MFVRVLNFILFVLLVTSGFTYGHELLLYPSTHETAFADLVGDGFLLESLDLDVGGVLQQDQAAYLIDLQEGMYVTASVLRERCSLLFKKYTIESLLIRCDDGLVGKRLTITVRGRWTLGGVKINGILIGKEAYRNKYFLEPGDVFDEKKHHHALDTIKRALREEGYFDAMLTVQLHKKPESMQIDVDIAISLGSAFGIGDIVIDAERYEGTDGNTLISKSRGVLVRYISKHRYAWASISYATSRLQQYLLKHGYSGAKIHLKESIDRNKKRVHLHFYLEGLERREFVFFGNHALSTDQLQGIITSFGSSVAIVPVSMVVQEVVDAYHVKGYWNVEVTAQEDTPFRTFIIINEQRQAWVEDIVVLNAEQVALKKMVRPFFKACLGKHYDAATYSRCLEQLCNWYRQQGYCQVQVCETKKVSLEENRYRLEVAIQEGPCSWVSDIVVPDYPLLMTQGPIGAYRIFLKQVKAVPFDQYVVQEHKRWLIEYFQQRGYLQPDVQYALQGEQGGLEIHWYIRPGPISYFGKTVVHGLSTVAHDQIMREMQYKKGEVWDPNKIRASIEALRNLGIFTNVHMYPDHEELLHGDHQQRTVVVHAATDDPFEVRVRGGIGVQQVGKNFVLGRGFTYKAGATFLAKNPCKKADYFVFDADFARAHQSINFEYRMPWLFNMPIRTVFKGYADTYDQPGFVGSKNPLYRITRQGCMMSAARFYKICECMINIGFEWMKTNVEPDNMALALRVGRAIDFKPTLLDKKIPYWLCEPTVCIDGVDNRLAPTRGAFFLASLKAMVPLQHRFNSAYFVKVQAEQSLYYPFSYRIIGGVRLRFGHIFHKDFSAVMPTERFYLGGAHSIRSYDTDLCPPVGVFRDQDDVERIAPRGGKTMVNLNLELRYIVYRAIEVVLLQDAGVLIGSGRLDEWVRKPHAVAGTGFGVRYNTPIGPVRFDIAWKWHAHKPFEHSYAWFLRLGQAF